MTPQEITKIVSEQSDFGFEMQVGHAYERAAAIGGALGTLTRSEPPEHAGTYVDSISGKPRQFDYRCRILRQGMMQGNYQGVMMAIECKNLDPAFPLILCGSARRDHEAKASFVESSNAAPHSPFCRTMLAKGHDTIHQPGQFVGKSLVRIKHVQGKGPAAAPDADVYEKWAQALASAVELAERACGWARERRWNNVKTAILPIVVVPDGSLWQLRFDEGGAVQGDAKRVEECSLFVGREVMLPVPPTFAKRADPLQFLFSHIHFLTLGGFRQFVSELMLNEGLWDRLIPESAYPLSVFGV